MLKIDERYVTTVHEAEGPEDLLEAVQAAIELEHATIPPYLTALFSIKQGTNPEIARILGSVLRQEMLHMAIACNLLNALGGSPSIDDPMFLPYYPGALPMGVRSGLSIGLEKLSRRLVYDVFMGIEEPENPMRLPVGEPTESLEALPIPEHATIGQFYLAIGEKLREWEAAGKNPIVGKADRQVSDPTWFAESELFPIRTVDDAVRGLDVIVEQGEGTQKSPVDDNNEAAHYYRFGEIVAGRRLVTIERPPGWAYAGEPVPLDVTGIWDLLPDAKAADYPADSQARVRADMFNAAYTRLLRCLHRVFNGEPGQLSMALSVMVEMQLAGQKLVMTNVPGTALFATPTFEYHP